MPTDIDKIVDGFPHPTIVPIIGVPTYESIDNLNLQLNANAASVQSNLGDGQLGLLYLTVTPAEYNMLSNVAFVPPTNPVIPVIAANATPARISTITRVHATRLADFREYLSTDKALKQQVIGAINNMYLRTLRHRVTGFANVTTRQMLDHLYASYGRLSPADLQENDKRLRTPYDPNQPIEAFIDQVEDAVSLAAAARAPYSPAQIVAVSYTIMFTTGMFPEACREWRRRPIGEQTWANFKTTFTEAHQDYRDSQATATQAGYHHANAAMEFQHDTAEAIANLATATASDRTTVANLTTTNRNLTNELAQAISKLNLAQTDLTRIKIQLASKTGHNPGSDTDERNFKPNTNYCWTHGYKVNRRHNSETCKNPGTGHKHDATRLDTKGGTQRGKE